MGDGFVDHQVGHHRTDVGGIGSRRRRDARVELIGVWPEPLRVRSG